MRRTLKRNTILFCFLSLNNSFSDDFDIKLQLGYCVDRSLNTKARLDQVTKQNQRQ